DGYAAVTFQKIAEKCGITRTTLYIYFKNKREIFLGSIRQITNDVEAQLYVIIEDGALAASEKLRRVLRSILATCEENRTIFVVLRDYLAQLQKGGKNPAERVNRRIIRLRHILSTLLIEGIDRGDLRPVSVKDANGTLFGPLEWAMFCLAVLNDADIRGMSGTFNLAIDGLLEKRPEEKEKRRAGKKKNAARF
ncbi:TetR/AcrR family transcriptional regulator, partial [Treponema endosymbiont of Eucomonympha sp.]|uniref:TetR/AcrR family transcriptional regulator n=1 Tax=Treponema endosymbiont of Eucomonympha sp. TaxID=1580831 RepID=UPI0007841C05